MSSQATDAALKRTPLYDTHVRLGGKMVDFGGWALPVQFSGILEEHRAVRTAAGLFDVSHMGEFVVSGPQALDLVNHLITNDAAALQDGQILYSPMCYENGGTVDDLLVYRLAAGRYLIVVNAANTDSDFAWVQQHIANFPQALVENHSPQWAQIALQGPRSEAILQTLTSTPLGEIRYYWFRSGVEVAGVECLVSRTGYTGEDGFELYCAAERASKLWDALLDAGRPHGLIPCGLGARDTLRFEARMPLYGHELDKDTTPLEAGLGMFVKLDKPSFVGKAALQRQKEQGLHKKLCGFEMVERGIPRAGYPIAQDGREIGVVTSGTFSPTLQKNLGLGFVPPALATPGTRLEVIIRGKGIQAEVVKTPFYKRPR